MSQSEERRAVTQSDRFERGGRNKPYGTISWEEHVEAHSAYAREQGYGCQTAERINERGGFGYQELVELLGREPTTWRPR